MVSKRIGRLQARRRIVADAKAAISTIAVGYIRVSTEEQAEHGHGLEVQEKAVRAFAESQGYELAEIYSDPGVSGGIAPHLRSGFGEMLATLPGRPAAVLLVWKFDRLARNIVFAVTAVTDLAEQFGVAIRSVTEPIDTATPMGRTIFAVLAGMAEQERETITERTWHGRHAKATKGGYSCGGVPIGYDVDGDGKLVVNELEAKIVRNIFAARRRKDTLAEIADSLNAAGFLTKRGGKWRAGSVAYVLDNPIYRGDVEYFFRRFGAGELISGRGAHEAIINQPEPFRS